LKTADEIVTLFCDRLFDERTGTLPEHFDDLLLPLGGHAEGTVEPGHQFEWAWLLAHYQRITGRDLRAYARALVGFAERYGVDQRTGAVLAAIRSDGVSIDRSERIWPAAERLQAAVAMFELDGQSPMAVVAQSGNRLLENHLAVTPAGAWMDQFSGDGAPKSSRIPASTLYHLMVSFTEVLRIKDAALGALTK
jgi:mannose/cellobiose epimerase-like protein (N-acyl-D-glucosamine 2-epimerase family)